MGVFAGLCLVLLVASSGASVSEDADSVITLVGQDVRILAADSSFGARLVGYLEQGEWFCWSGVSPRFESGTGCVLHLGGSFPSMEPWIGLLFAPPKTTDDYALLNGSVGKG